jgi:hypothetical protein
MASNTEPNENDGLLDEKEPDNLKPVNKCDILLCICALVNSIIGTFFVIKYSTIDSSFMQFWFVCFAVVIHSYCVTLLFLSGCL